MVKNWPASAGDMGSVPGLGRSLGEGNGDALYFCLQSTVDRGAWWVAVHRAGHIVVTKQQLFAGKEREEGERFGFVAFINKGL